jgi:ABC-type spermidine/putrescine transport system permease subunit II
MENEFPDVINTVFSTSNYNNLFHNFDFRLILHSIIVSVTSMTTSLVVKQKDIPTLLVSL